jgi:hypothetical protein
MKCQSCGSKRLVTLWMKCNDLASVTFKGRKYDKSIPDDLCIHSPVNFTKLHIKEELLWNP